MKEASFLAILTNGEHVVGFGIFATHAEWKKYVKRRLTGVSAMIHRFFYAWGIECQEYTQNEVHEVYF